MLRRMTLRERERGEREREKQRERETERGGEHDGNMLATAAELMAPHINVCVYMYI